MTKPISTKTYLDKRYYLGNSKLYFTYILINYTVLSDQ